MFLNKNFVIALGLLFSLSLEAAPGPTLQQSFDRKWQAVLPGPVGSLLRLFEWTGRKSLNPDYFPAMTEVLKSLSDQDKRTFAQYQDLVSDEDSEFVQNSLRRFPFHNCTSKNVLEFLSARNSGQSPESLMKNFMSLSEKASARVMLAYAFSQVPISKSGESFTPAQAFVIVKIIDESFKGDSQAEYLFGLSDEETQETQVAGGVLDGGGGGFLPFRLNWAKKLLRDEVLASSGTLHREIVNSRVRVFPSQFVHSIESEKKGSEIYSHVESINFSTRALAGADLTAALDFSTFDGRLSTAVQEKPQVRMSAFLDLILDLTLQHLPQKNPEFWYAPRYLDSSEVRRRRSTGKILLDFGYQNSAKLRAAKDIVFSGEIQSFQGAELEAARRRPIYLLEIPGTAQNAAVEAKTICKNVGHLSETVSYQVKDQGFSFVGCGVDPKNPLSYSSLLEIQKKQTLKWRLETAQKIAAKAVEMISPEDLSNEVTDDVVEFYRLSRDLFRSELLDLSSKLKLVAPFHETSFFYGKIAKTSGQPHDTIYLSELARYGRVPEIAFLILHEMGHHGAAPWGRDLLLDHENRLNDLAFALIAKVMDRIPEYEALIFVDEPMQKQVLTWSEAKEKPFFMPSSQGTAVITRPEYQKRPFLFMTAAQLQLKDTDSAKYEKLRAANLDQICKTLGFKSHSYWELEPRKVPTELNVVLANGAIQPQLLTPVKPIPLAVLSSITCQISEP